MELLKNKYFVPALSLLLLSCAFHFEKNDITWMWTEQPVVGVILFLTSIVFWGLLKKTQ